MVLRGLIENGVIKPLQPLPSALPEGTEIEFEVVAADDAVSDQRRAEIEAFFTSLNSEGGIEKEDLDRFNAAVAEERRLARDAERSRES